VPTGLTCATCGTPICPKCMVVTPVGMKCPNCGRGKGSALFQVRPERFALAGITALAFGAISTIIGFVGFFAYFIAIPYGYFAGTTIMKAAGMKRGLKVEILTGVGMALGALATRFPDMFGPGGFSPSYVFVAIAYHPFMWIAVVISISCAVSKIRYM